MTIEGGHTIEGRGTVVTGRVTRGALVDGDTVELVGAGRSAVVTDLESSRRPIDAARAGDSVGMLLRGVRRDEVARGQVVAG